jgi:hypothetical protein
MLECSIVIIFSVLAVVGIVLIMAVQMRIISQYGMQVFRERRFIDVYWHGLTRTEKYCFWTGLVLVLLPFAAVGLWRAVRIMAGN